MPKKFSTSQGNIFDTTRHSGSVLPSSREEVLTEADWPFLHPGDRRARVRKRLYAILFILLSVLFSVGSVQIYHEDESAFVRLERMYRRPSFFRPASRVPLDDYKMAEELNITVEELYDTETILNRFFRSQGDEVLGPLDWGITTHFGGYTIVFSYRIFLNMGISALMVLALYIRARDRAASVVIDGQNRQLRQLNEELERKIQEAQRYLDELTQAQSKLLQAQKLASIGRLSATLAHEIRNPLSIIQSSAGMVSDDLPEGTTGHQAIGLIKHEITRLNNIITELLNFARPKPPSLGGHNLNKLLEAWLLPIREELDKTNLKLSIKMASDIPYVLCDPDQLYQVMLNVVWNARDALKNTTNGQITLHTKSAPGKGVALIVEDNGPGMEEETLAQIYEPFYTTKTHGSGLGLPVVQQLMEGMGGSAVIESELERGTTVYLFLRQDRRRSVRPDPIEDSTKKIPSRKQKHERRTEDLVPNTDEEQTDTDTP